MLRGLRANRFPCVGLSKKFRKRFRIKFRKRFRGDDSHAWQHLHIILDISYLCQTKKFHRKNAPCLHKKRLISLLKTPRQIPQNCFWPVKNSQTSISNCASTASNRGRNSQASYPDGMPTPHLYTPSPSLPSSAAPRPPASTKGT